MAPASATFLLSLDLADEAATLRLADDLAALLSAGDLITLSGDLGAGKSTFARALLRAFAADPALEVPSPTFTLVQTYDLPRLTVSHLDLYRLDEPEEVLELGLDDLVATGAALVEWPEKAAGLLPRGALSLRFEPGQTDDGRRVIFSVADPAHAGRWGERLERTIAIRALMARAGFGFAARRYLIGDAAARTYERLHFDDRTAIVMNAPPLYTLAGPGETPSYGEIVHRARTVTPFLALTEELRRRGFAAPQIHAADEARCLIVLEDLGSDTLVRDRAPIQERYEAAALLLADMHATAPWSETLPLPDGGSYTIPAYSRRALLTEADLFLDWYVPWRAGVPVSPDFVSADLRAEYHALWNRALDDIAHAETGWVLRDYHSPNIIWREHRSGFDRLGLIDYQDCVLGPLAYDVSSLALDARVDMSVALERHLVEVYVAARRAVTPDFDADAFHAAYAVTAAQRVAKILGLFIRLNLREGKPGYMAHLPRMAGYLDRALAHPVLDGLRTWFHRRIGT
ncbi:tRNA (adenosine(37)-N6)-threonylcarbamoyltransferase complex ATPase subunit type 1 TsaE [Pannonibacter tanglangensis]|uniref:tRNA threonylcarbamoyladenosine biosynthesis protein TsaE n=1 Tax=Pannonibacter tanglangensis TaxID=2750084 RepID=A0ABW9ZJX7_9HYPH|nr:tRNA (adenosine(37)-N6)-threonylcarbamoyltransferase complex ATPase subunit type 1 TsaE [Pannonibacter sp. XCT-34]NBN64983.1 tRNA (adenosine(37)-N6)-threonylcarbamoyltransferase complex ATPase subunit type 1 TsaE [Pannonibacter sp. XCT-34]